MREYEHVPTVEGSVQPDGSLVVIVRVSPHAKTVNVGGVTWPVPVGATHMRIELHTSDTGETRHSARAVYQGDTTT